MMMSEQFAGAEKVGESILAPLEHRLARAVLPRIPNWLQTDHLTWMTLVWCALIVGLSALAAGDRRWLWAVSLMVALQYVTDFFDGKLGKYRQTGLVKWGFYMDHFLDYVFLCSLLIGYSFLLSPAGRLHLLFVLAVFAGFMVNSFLTFAATSRFDINFFKFGPTEFRIAIIVINALVVGYGTRGMERALPYVAAGGLVGLSVLVFRTQRVIRAIDFAAKNSD